MTVLLALSAFPLLKPWSALGTLFTGRHGLLRRRRNSLLKRVSVLSFTLRMIASYQRASVIPVVGSPAEPATWTHLVATIDVIIDAARDDKNHKLMIDIFKLVTDAAQRLRPVGAPKLSFIATTGVGVHGDSRTEFVTDTTPITRPIALAAGRAKAEQEILKNDVVNGIVIRPSLVYGRSGSLTEILFGSAAAGKAQWYGEPGARLGLIHTDDLADLYLRAAEKAQLIGGQAFSGVNSFTESVEDILAKATYVSGAKEAPAYIDTAGNRDYFHQT